jgi:hypothetical protein
VNGENGFLLYHLSELQSLRQLYLHFDIEDWGVCEYEQLEHHVPLYIPLIEELHVVGRICKEVIVFLSLCRFHRMCRLSFILRDPDSSKHNRLRDDEFIESPGLFILDPLIKAHDGRNVFIDGYSTDTSFLESILFSA